TRRSSDLVVIRAVNFNPVGQLYSIFSLFSRVGFSLYFLTSSSTTSVTLPSTYSIQDSETSIFCRRCIVLWLDTKSKKWYLSASVHALTVNVRSNCATQPFR